MPAKSNAAADKRQEKSRKPTRRIPVTIKWLRWSGIQRGDKATVVMNGDVRVGELGYFSIRSYGQAYKQLRFVFEQDDRCRLSHPSACTPGGICLRERRGIDGYSHECTGDHDGLAYGRDRAPDRAEQRCRTCGLGQSTRPDDDSPLRVRARLPLHQARHIGPRVRPLDDG